MTCRRFPALLFVIISCLTLALGQDKPKENIPAARAVSDAFIANLMVHQIGAAISKYDSQWIQTMQKPAEQAIAENIQACGAPKSNKAENPTAPVQGDTVLQDGTRKVALTFLYPASKGHMSVEVERNDNDKDYHVSAFGCQKRRVNGQ